MSKNLGTRSALTRPPMPLLEVSVTDTLGTTQAIDLSGYSAWAVRSPDESVGSLAVYASASEGGTYTVVQVDDADVTVTLSTSKWNNPNALVFAHSWVKLVGDAVGDIELVGKG